MKVKLTDVAERITGNEDRFTTSLQYYLAGEHYDSERLAIYRKGIIQDDLNVLGFKFHFPFKAGDTIIMARNPHLKKAGMVTYDGICSDASIILRTKNNNVLLSEYLPLVFQNDFFWRWFEANKSGSVNYLLNWKTLKDYVFDLPPIDEQRKFARLIWAYENVRLAYEKLVQKSDELVKSQFVEMFGDYETNPKGWHVVPFDEFASIDGNMTTDYEKYADYPHIGIDSIEKDTGNLSGYRTVKEDNVISGKYIFTSAHIIYSKIRPNLNKVALPEFEGLCSADAYPILPNAENCNRIYLAVLLRSSYFLSYILGFSARSNMPKVNRQQISGFKAPLPPLSLQQRFAEFYQQTDKSKLAVKQALESLDAMQKALMRKHLGGE